jgi:hypothetical protein
MHFGCILLFYYFEVFVVKELKILLTLLCNSLILFPLHRFFNPSTLSLIFVRAIAIVTNTNEAQRHYTDLL